MDKTPFLDNTYPSNPIYGPEAEITLDPTSGLIHAPKPPTGQKLSKLATEFGRRMVDIHNDCHPVEAAISESGVPEGLLRSIELIDADPEGNLQRIAKSKLQVIRTSSGNAYGLSMRVTPSAVLSDPTNGRVVQNTIGRRADSTFKVVGETELGTPVVSVDSAEALIAMVHDARFELGFLSSEITHEKDLTDLISIALQGVHSDLTLMPIRCEDNEGGSSYFWVAIDGNRRLEALRRIIRAVTGLSDAQVVGATDHLIQGSAVKLRDPDVEAVRNIRRKQMYGDVRGGMWEPHGHARDAEAVAAFLNHSAAGDIRIRTMLRTRSVDATLLVGYDPKSVVGDGRDAPAKLMSIATAYVRSVHISSAAQKQWEPEAQQFIAMRESLDRMRAGAVAGIANYLPVTVDEIDTILNRETAGWSIEPCASAPDGPIHPVALALKGSAAIACNGQDGEAAARAAMQAMSIAVTGRNSTNHKAEIASRLAADVLLPMGTKKGTVDRARTSIDRAIRSRSFWDVKSHPNGLADPWWRHIDDPTKELVDAASEELDRLDPHNLEDHGAGWFGPSGRALAHKALIVQTSSPAVRGTQYQLTQTGIGGTRGNTMVGPEVVIYRMLETPDGIRQLGEIVEAGIGTTLRLPQNTIDPTEGPLDEFFLRGERLGWEKKTTDSEASGPGGKPAEQVYEEKWAALSDSLLSAAEAIRDLTEPERQFTDEFGRTLLDVFNERGFDASDDSEIMVALRALQRSITKAAIIAERT